MGRKKRGQSALAKASKVARLARERREYKALRAREAELIQETKTVLERIRSCAHGQRIARKRAAERNQVYVALLQAAWNKHADRQPGFNEPDWDSVAKMLSRVRFEDEEVVPLVSNRCLLAYRFGAHRVEVAYTTVLDMRDLDHVTVDNTAIPFDEDGCPWRQLVYSSAGPDTTSAAVKRPELILAATCLAAGAAFTLPP
jgi:hypothetical protein